jgi:DNA adenine methylase
VTDTTRLRGGPLIRYGGKGRMAHLLLPHFARAAVYAEPFFGGGGMFFAIPPGTYAREAVNDLDGSIVTFFRVLRDRTAELVRACELTPYARAEFAAALARGGDELEEARRVWVRSRQGFGGYAGGACDWSRSAGDGATWNPAKTASKLAALTAYARRLAQVAIDNVDATDFVAKWGQAGAFLYCDPPYVRDARTEPRGYAHEMTDDDHRRFGAACAAAAARGAPVAGSGYASRLYDEALFAGWRRVEIDVASSAMRGNGARRTEVLWMSYPPEDALGYERQPSLFAATPTTPPRAAGETR